MKNNDHDTEKKLLAAIALSAQQRSEQAITSNTNDKVWQQFLQHQNVGDEQLLASIDSDPDRFDEWVKHAKPAAKTSSLRFKFAKLWDAWTLPSIPMATAALLLLSVLVLLQLNHQQDPLQQSYAHIAQLIPVDQNTSSAVQPLILANNNSFGFATKNTQHTQLAAFRQGVDIGRQTLAPQSKITNPATTSSHPHWQRFGEWYQLNRYVAHSKHIMQASYWQQQLSILQQLDVKLSVNPTRSMLKQALLNLQQQPQNPRYQLAFKQQLANYWQALLMSSDAQ